MRWYAVTVFLFSAFAANPAYSVLWGDVGFSEPVTWAEVARADIDSASIVAFVLPRPAHDTAGPVANVIIEISLSHGHRDLKEYAAAKLREVAAGPGTPRLIEETELRADSARSSVWSSTIRGIEYEVIDRLAVRDSIYVDIRTVVPAPYRTDTAWQARYHAELDTLTHSICVGPTPVYRSVGIPCADIAHVLPFTRAENADGSRFVWYVARFAQTPYPYVKTSDLPASPSFREIPSDSLNAGDLVWWPSFVALFSGPTRMLNVPDGPKPLPDYVAQLGPPRFFRRVVTP